MTRTVLAFIHVLGAVFTAAQTFVPNPAWRNTNITTSFEERVTIAKGAIDTTLSMMVDEKGQLKFEDMNYASAARLFAHMAEFDGFTNQSIYRSQLLNLFSQAETFRPGFAHSSINWRLEYSIAAVHAYTTYSDSIFLDWAKTAWSSGRSYALSEEDLRPGSGKVFGNNQTMRSTCGNLTMAGGAFWTNSSSFLNALSTGSYLIATSMLAESTKEELYRVSGVETEAFYINHLLNALGDMLDGINGDDCAPHDGTYAANAGIMIEGLAVLAWVTKTPDLYDHLSELLNKTVSNTGWYSEEGIVAADRKNQTTAEHVGQFIVRGLAAIYQRNTTHSSLRDYIRQCLGVQYNAVLNNARSVGSNPNIYSADWTPGSSVPNFNFDSQANAMSILVAAIPVRDSDTPDPTSAGPPAPTGTKDPASNPHPPNTGAIAGGVVGGLALVSLILVAALYFIRRRRSLNSRTGSEVDSNQNNAENGGAHGQLQPFTLISEKNRLQPKFRTELPATSTSDYTGFSGSSALTSSSGAEPSRLGSVVPTEELVRMLNERLQSGPEWRDDEPPPDYASYRR